MGTKAIDIIGNQYGYLTVIKRVENKGESTVWQCKCKCGNIIDVRRSSLICGDNVSCGCYKKENNKMLQTKHGMYNTKIYKRWWGIHSRCYYPVHRMYPRYGGRGIKMCESWKNSFQEFYNWCIKNGYDEKLTIDRIDNNGDYTPNNCRFVNRKEQYNNKNTPRNDDGTFSKS